MIAISAESVENVRDKMLPKGLTFPLLADPELTVIDAWGLRHEGGNPFGGDISRPAIFILDEDGRILWRAFTENWRVRPTPEDIFAEATKQ